MSGRPIVFVVRRQYRSSFHAIDTLFHTGEQNTARFEGGGGLTGPIPEQALIANVEAQWQDSGRFWEYYHAEMGQGLGADHQTGWTALVANLISEKYGTGTD